jgi:predicted permease
VLSNGVILNIADRMDTFWASLQAVATAATLASTGVYLHRENFVNKDTLSVLSRFSERLAIPALLFSRIVRCQPHTKSDNMCASVLDNLSDAWIFFVWPVYVVGCGLFVGWMVTRIVNTPTWQRRSVITAVAFGNSTGLPITLLAVIKSTVPGSSKGVDPNVLLSMYLILYPVLQFSIGGWLLSPQEGYQGISVMDVQEISLHRNGSIPANPSISDLIGVSQRSSTRRLEETGLISTSASASSRRSSSGGLDNRTTGPSSTRSLDIPTIVTTSPTPWFGLLSNDWSTVFPFPVRGAVCGLVVVAIPPLRALFLDVRGHGHAVLLGWLFAGVQKIGQAAIPLNMAVLGVNLSIVARSSEAPVSAGTVAGVVVGKLAVMPLVGIATVLLLKHYVLEADKKSSFYTVLMLVFVTPTANNVMVICDRSSAAAKECMATLIGYQYLVAPVLLTLSIMAVVYFD